MSRFKHMHDDNLERLLAGRMPAGDPGLDGVAGFANELRAAYANEPVPAHLEDAHIAAIVAAAETLAENGAPATTRRGRPRRGPRPLRLALKLAAVTAALVLLFCGLAWAGTLPAPVQDLASRAASAIGVQIKRPHAAPPTPRDVVVSPVAKPSSTAKQGSPARPNAAASPAKSSAAHSGTEHHGTAQGQAGAEQPAQPEDQDVEQGEPEAHDEDQSDGQPQSHDEDQVDGQPQDPHEGDRPPQDPAGDGGSGDEQPHDQPAWGN